MVRIAKFCPKIIMPLFVLENTSNDNIKMRVISCYKSEKSKFVKHCDAIEKKNWI